MTFFTMLNGAFTVVQQLELLLRLMVATFCGAAIGFERTKRLKEAGLRTHCVVACGAALLMIVSKYCFADLTLVDMGSRGVDPARIAAQVVSGIGFLGAGMIFRNGISVKGLTTAAGIWATAAVGMCVGSGLYFIGLFAALLIVLIQTILHRLNVGNDAFSTQHLSITFGNSKEMEAALDELLQEMQAQVIESSIDHQEENVVAYKLLLRTRKVLTFDRARQFMREHPEVMRFSI